MNLKLIPALSMALILYGCGAEVQDEVAEHSPYQVNCDEYEGEQSESVCDPDIDETTENNNEIDVETLPDSKPITETPAILADADLCEEDCTVSEHSFDSAKAIVASHETVVSARLLKELILQPSISEDISVDYESAQTLQDIKFVYISDKTIELHNNTPRSFKSVLANDEDGNPIIVRFTSNVMPYQKTTLSGSNIKPLVYRSASMVFSPMFTHSGRAESDCPAEEGSNGWTCGVLPTKNEAKVIDTLTANTKTILSSKNLLPLLKISAFGGSYKNTQRKGMFCENDNLTCEVNRTGISKSRGYLYNLTSVNHNISISRLKTYLRGYQGLGGGSSPHKQWGEGHKGTKNGISLKFLSEPIKTGQYNTFLHEIGHAMQYGHKSGFTYGFPDIFKKYLSENVEFSKLLAFEAPETITHLKLEGNSIIATFYSSKKVKNDKVKFQIANFHDLEYKIKSSADKPSIAIEFDSMPKSRTLFLTQNNINETVMTQDVFTGSAYLKQLNDGYFISADTIANISQDLFLDTAKSPKTLGQVCKAYLGRSFELASPEYALNIAQENQSFIIGLDKHNVSTTDEMGNAYSVNLRDQSKKRSKKITDHHIICKPVE